MRFWDSSAIVPLLVSEAATTAMQAILREDPAMLVWWASEVECVSAIARLERQDELSATAAATALDRMDAAIGGWGEVQPTRAVRLTARRLLRTHPLRAADAQQLAAAVVAAEGVPSSLTVVTLDDRLRDAARREGFRVLPETAEEADGPSGASAEPPAP